MTKRLTQKRKDILRTPLASSWAVQALFNVDDFLSDYGESFDHKGFREHNGFTVKEAQEALAALVNHLR